MKIRTAIMYALVILLLTGLTATAWYYWLTEGGSTMKPVSHFQFCSDAARPCI